MKKLLNKPQRVINRALIELFSGKLFDSWPEALKRPSKNIIGRTLELGNNKSVLLNDRGEELERLIVTTISDANLFQGDAAFSDIWTAFHDTLGHCLAAGVAPEDANELVALLTERLVPKIKNRTFVVSLIGVELAGVESLELGPLLLVAPSLEFIRSQGLLVSDDELATRVKRLAKHLPWLVGTCKGTDRVALERFQEQARLATGMLAVSAAATFQNGAHRFHIAALLSAEDGIGHCESLFWDDERKSLGYRLNFRKAQNYVIDAAVAAQLQGSKTFSYSFKVFQEPNPTDLEQAIARSVFWFADAHRDSLPVMRFVKYWSCIESFFTSSKDEITKSVAVGTACVLTFGPFGFLPKSDYLKSKARMANLYALRSRAVHRASHKHVTSVDVALLSQWTSWLVLSMIAFAESGYKGLELVLKRSLELDDKIVGEAQQTNEGATDDV